MSEKTAAITLKEFLSLESSQFVEKVIMIYKNKRITKKVGEIPKELLDRKITGYEICYINNEAVVRLV